MLKSTIFLQIAAICGLTEIIGGSPTILIIGGENATQGEIPYQIRIATRRWKNHCGGALVDIDGKQFVVTTATCVFTENVKDLTLVAGDLEISEESGWEQIRRVQRYIIHPGFNYHSKVHDIAILEYQYPFDLSEDVQTVPLPWQGQPTSGDVMVSGWGAKTQDGGGWTNHLQKVKVSTISDEECSEIYESSGDRFVFTPGSALLCAQTRNGRSSHCYTDLGGPVVSLRRGYLAGLVAYPDMTCSMQPEGVPDVYTEVSNYVDWLSSYANKK